MSDKYICCLCGKIKEGFGNNPSPFLVRYSGKPIKPNDQCCDECNMGKVLPERMKRFSQ